MNELPIPPAASGAANAREMVRVWIVDGKMQVVLMAPAWDDPAAWGLLLVDLAKHVSDAYSNAEGRDAATVLSQIKAGFDVEWINATTETTGGFVE